MASVMSAVGVSPWSRWTRAGVFASVCLALSAGGHTAASGHPVGVAGIAVGFVAVLLLGWAGAGRERGFGQILGWLLWGELALHLLFSQTCCTVGGAAAHVGHDPVTGLAAALGSGSPAGSGGMLAAHLAAAVLSAWWLRRGEAAAFALAGWLAVALFGPVLWRAPRPWVCAVPMPRPPAVPERGGRDRVFWSAVPTRGPPSDIRTR